METKNISLFKIFSKLAPIIVTACPVFFIMTNIIGIFHSLSYGLTTVVTSKFFDTVTASISSHSNIKSALIMIIIVGLITILSQALNGIHNFMGMELIAKLTSYLSFKYQDKCKKLSPILFEDTKLLDEINKAKQGINGGIWFVSTIITSFTFYLPYLIFMGVYLYSLKPILATSLLLIFIPTVLNQLIKSTVFAKLEDTVAPIRREVDYYQSCITSRELFKETRLIGGYKFFKNLYLTSLSLLSKESWKSEFKTNLLELLTQFITLLGYCGVLLLLVDTFMKNEISVGSFAAVFASINMMYGIMTELIYQHIGSLAKSFGSVQNYIEFLDLPERSGKTNNFDLNKGIDLNNVSFSYPNSKTKSLTNINLKINQGETIAVVGENGAGKSTIVKLIMGLYLPTEGTVKIGGLDTSVELQDNIFKHISAVFQNYQQYKMTLEANLKISDFGSNKALNEVIKDADIDLNDKLYPNGLDTILSKEFDGVDISGGQWQRIAIGRGLYKNHDIIILDEPTSAIDPVEETRIYKKFAEISKGCTSIIVTHRLGSARIADRIVVMDKGEIIQIGSHDELLSKGGKYSEMWQAQAKYYNLNSTTN